MELKTKARIAKRTAEIIDQEKSRLQKNSGSTANVVPLEANRTPKPQLKVIEGGK